MFFIKKQTPDEDIQKIEEKLLKHIEEVNHPEYRKIRYSLEIDWDEEKRLAFMVRLEKERSRRDKTFTEMVLWYIDEKGLRDSKVYKAAHIDRRLYSKMICDKEYKPSKDTCLSFVFALQLPVDEAKELLEKAGYTLSKSIRREIALEFLLREGIYELDTVNRILMDLGEKTIGRD